VNHFRRTVAVVAPLAATVIVAVTSAQADPAKKVLVCHGTGSATNPYVLIDVSGNSDPARLTGNGEQNRAADFLYDGTSPSCEAQLAGGGGGPYNL
jgi:hypothetical protein